MTYVALLRGINVGGNNKIPMAELRACFEAAGFTAVRTYINSGNVLFESQATDETQLVGACEAAIEKQFGFFVRVSVIGETELRDAMDHAPSWWGTDTGSKHNAIFVIAPASAEEIIRSVGEAKPEYERVASHGRVIFWSAPIKTFSRSRWSGIVGTKAYRDITIRNSNTTKKLLELM